MGLPSLGGLGPANISGAGGVSGPGGSAQKFGEVMKGQQASGPSAGEVTPQVLSPGQQTASPARCAAGVERVGAPHAAASPVAASLVDRVSKAQARMEHVLQLAQSGRDFSPAELLSLQTQAYRASQELDLAGKVVEKATNGVKQVLQTQV